MSAHGVLQLPVPELEEWVRTRTALYDTDYLSADPRFGHAHITALAPFDLAPTPEMVEEIARIAAQTGPIEVTLGRVAQFPSGLIYLAPEPQDQLRALTTRLVQAFPCWQPYAGLLDAGLFDAARDPTPHLTLDLAGPQTPGVSIASTAASLGELIGIRCVLTRLQLARYQPGACAVIDQWPLDQ